MKIKTQLFLFIIIFLLFGCNNEKGTATVRSCIIEQLLFSQSDYPPNTIANDIRTSIAEYPLESAGGSASYNGDGIMHLVARYFSVECATEEYEKWEKFVFNPDDVIGSWETPQTLNPETILANQYKIACGITSFGRRCYMVAQYEEYYIFFWADISTNGITIEKYIDFVLRINEKMLSCLGK